MFYFAEGTRSEIPDQMRPFKVGAFKLSSEGGVDVLPIALCGAGRLWRKGSKTSATRPQAPPAFGSLSTKQISSNNFSPISIIEVNL